MRHTTHINAPLTHTNEPCHTHQWAIPHTPSQESHTKTRHIYKCTIRQTPMSHWHTPMSHWHTPIHRPMSQATHWRVAHTNASRHAYKYVILPIQTHHATHAIKGLVLTGCIYCGLGGGRGVVCVSLVIYGIQCGHVRKKLGWLQRTSGTYMYVCVCVCMYVFIHMYVCRYGRRQCASGIYVCVCMCVCIYIVYMCVCMYGRRQCASIIYVYAYVCACLCVCTYAYIPTWRDSKSQVKG